MPEGLISTHLSYKSTIVVAPRLLSLTDRPTPLVELATYPWMLSQIGCGMRSTLRRAISVEGLSLNVAVEAFGSELQLSLVARGTGLGLTTSELLARSRHRDLLQIVDVPDFRSGLNVWLVHHALPGRLMRPVAMIRDVLIEVLR